jgi:hypothetical protein
VFDKAWRTLVAPLALALTAACGVTGKQATASSSPSASPPPPPTPAISKKEGEKVLLRYDLALNRAHARLSAKLAAAALGGSALQVETGRYRIFKANHIKAAPVKYGAAEGFSPKESGYPKWFAALLTDQGIRPYTRDITVFVQEHPGDPWRAVYAPFTTSRRKGPIARGVHIADFPDVVPGDDSSVVLPPARLAGAMSDLLNNGTKSQYHSSIAVSSEVLHMYRSLKSQKKEFASIGWSGTEAYQPASTPFYALRTTSGGAVAWFAVERKIAVQHVHHGDKIVWSTDWGDVLRAYTGHSAVNKTLTSVERFELAAYVPPGGRGKVQILGTHWAPISVQGR